MLAPLYLHRLLFVLCIQIIKAYLDGNLRFCENELKV